LLARVQVTSYNSHLGLLRSEPVRVNTETVYSDRRGRRRYDIINNDFKFPQCPFQCPRVSQNFFYSKYLKFQAVFFSISTASKDTDGSEIMLSTSVPPSSGRKSQSC